MQNELYKCEKLFLLNGVKWIAVYISFKWNNPFYKDRLSVYRIQTTRITICGFGHLLVFLFTLKFHITVFQTRFFSCYCTRR